MAVAIGLVVSMGVTVGSFRETVADWLESRLKADFYVSPVADGSRGAASHDERGRGRAARGGAGGGGRRPLPHLLRPLRRVPRHPRPCGRGPLSPALRDRLLRRTRAGDGVARSRSGRSGDRERALRLPARRRAGRHDPPRPRVGPRSSSRSRGSSTTTRGSASSSSETAGPSSRTFPTRASRAPGSTSSRARTSRRPAPRSAGPSPGAGSR